MTGRAPLSDTERARRMDALAGKARNEAARDRPLPDKVEHFAALVLRQGVKPSEAFRRAGFAD